MNPVSAQISPLEKKFTKLASVFSIIVILLGISVEIGWYFNITALKSLFPGIVNMNPVSALSFIFLGTSIFLLNKTEQKKPWIYFIYASTIFIFLVGFLRFIAIIFGIDLHHDQLLFHDKILNTGFGQNRIAPNTALNFMFMACALFLLLRKKNYYVVHTFVFFTSSIALLAILGYSYSVENLYGFLSYTPMALNTAVGFSLSAFAMLFASHSKGAMQIIAADTLGGRAVRQLLPILVIVPSVLGWLRLQGERMGLYDTEYGTALLVIAIIVIFQTIVFELSKKIHKIDLVQQQLQSHIQELVEKRTQQFAQEHARLDASINSLQIGYLMTDKSTKLVSFNSAAQKILDEPSLSTEILIRYFSSRLDLKQAMNESFTQNKASFFRQITIGTKYLDLFIAPIFTDAANTKSEILGLVILIEDVTEEKVMQRSRDEFFSIASHELRTPLIAIRGNASMLLENYKEKLPDPEMKNMIEDIHKSSVRLIEMVADLLDSSSLEQGKVVFNNDLFDIIPLIDELIANYKEPMSAKKLQLTISKPTFPLQVFADKAKTKEILSHILSNAIKFTDQGQIDITLVTTDPIYVKILISDTGRGIATANQSLLFHKVQQAGDSLYTRDSEKGTGMGLYLAKLLATGMGGAAKLEKSEEGKGSTFSISLRKNK